MKLLKNKFLLLGALFTIFTVASLPDVLAMKRKHTDDDNHLPTKKTKIDDGKQDESDEMNIDDSLTSITLLNLPFDTLNIITQYVTNDHENLDTRYHLSETCTIFHDIVHDIQFKKCIKDRIKEAYSDNNETREKALQKLCELVITSPQFATFNERFDEDIIKQIIDAGLNNSSHQDLLVRESALQLFTALVDKDQGFDAAITAATQNSSHQDSWIRESALRLFTALVDKDQGFDAAITAAAPNSSHEDLLVRAPALKLLSALLDKDQGFEASITAAAENSSHQEWWIRRSALNLFMALFDKNQGFHTAIETATLNSSHQDLWVRKLAQQLLIALREKNYEPAYEMIKK